ncbi:MAG: FkbM family methyltransferase [Desulfovibrio sp.]|nr:FkbM family methyltransferase [Desulfovibrio sp.]
MVDKIENEYFEHIKNWPFHYSIFLYNKDIDYISKKIFSENIPYELPLLNHIVKNVKHKSVFLDIGANIGNHSLYVAANTDAKIICFEPNINLVKALKLSKEKNKFDNITIYENALGSQLSHGKFKEIIPNNSGSQQMITGNGDIIIKTLDSYDIKNISVIKIDVEGMEFDVLKGGLNTIKNNNPIIYVECSSKQSYLDCFLFLYDLGYNYVKTFNATPTHLFIHQSQIDIYKKEIIYTSGYMLYDQLPQAEEKARELNSRLEEANAKYRNLSESSQAQKTQLSQAEEKARELNSRLEEANAKYRNLSESSQAQKTQLSQAEEKARELNSRLEEANAKYRNLSESSQAQKAQLTQAEEKARELNSRLEEANAKYRNLSESSQAQKAQLSQAEKNTEELIQEKNSLQDQLQQAQLSTQQKSEALFSANKKYRVMSQNVDRLKERIALYESRNGELAAKLDAANKKYRASTERIAILRDRLAKKERNCFRKALDLFKKNVHKQDSLVQSPSEVPAELPSCVPVNNAENVKSEVQYSSSDRIQALKDGHISHDAPLLIACRDAVHSPEKFRTWLHGLKVACIMDEFTWGSYSPEANMMQLTPQNWHEEIEGFQPDMCFVESAWRGKDELWTNTVHKIPDELLGILEWCRTHHVPTIFWNKEDPIHFETFQAVAMLFDVVFTYDFNCVERYRSLTGRRNAFFLPMAVQPRMFNPIEKYERQDAFCFAGSYYVRYPERTRDLDDFLDHLPSFRPVEIYDRQFGKDHPDYMFPEKFRPLIKGCLPYEQMDKAYKGYRYAINLNSIKQAQSLARRVFELMACNTLTVSNFSSGVRTEVGDLVLMSDSGRELVRRLELLDSDPARRERLCLAGLRKVMEECTYEDRLAYILCSLSGVDVPELLPQVNVAACVKSETEGKSVLTSFARQNYPLKKLYLFAPDNASAWACLNVVTDVTLLGFDDTTNLAEYVEADWLAVFSPEDYYGPSYLKDLALASRYAPDAYAFTKGTYYRWNGEACERICKATPYTWTKQAVLRHSLVRTKKVFTARLDTSELSSLSVECHSLSLDAFNYCLGGGSPSFMSQASVVNDLDDIWTGFSIRDMQKEAESIEPEKTENSNMPSIQGELLLKEFGKATINSKVSTNFVNEKLSITSSLSEDAFEYRMGATFFPVKDVCEDSGDLKIHVTSSGNVRPAYFFLDEKRKKLSSACFAPNQNFITAVPDTATFVRFGLRVPANDVTEISDITFGHKILEPARIFSDTEYLVVTNHYPSYDNLYRYAFVHSRVRCYREKGLRCDVFCLTGNTISFDEFEGVNVIRGSASALRNILDRGKVRSILVHFLDAAMWDVLKDYADRIRINVWVHGSEIQPAHRRIFACHTESEKQKILKSSEKRIEFWKSIFNNFSKKIHFIFVSHYFLNTLKEDYKLSLSHIKHSIVHNPIDTKLFQYREKNESQRWRILSIRPFTSTYPNDLSVQCILRLAKRPDFKHFDVRIIGDGPLFDETLAPLSGISNITIDRRFLSQIEIAELHGEYGIFLCPSRIDSQGVSRDEAMSSGLVPVTNAVAAIPEFTDETCAILAPPEDAEAMAEGIARLVDKPDIFLAMSRAAAERVRKQSAAAIIIDKELALIRGE